MSTTQANTAPETLADLATRIRTGHELLVSGARAIVDRAIRIGHDLIKAKAMEGYGNWGKWLKDNCALNERTALRYVELAKGEAVLLTKVTSDTMSELTLNEAKRLIDEAQSGTGTNSGSGTGTEKKTTKTASDKYDTLQDKLIEKLKALALSEAEAAAKETIEKLNSVLRDKRVALESEMKKAA